MPVAGSVYCEVTRELDVVAVTVTACGSASRTCVAFPNSSVTRCRVVRASVAPAVEDEERAAAEIERYQTRTPAESTA
ncbi:MAG: hypothetical protein QN210_12050, partial [Armatimonadota bacterium]|nr:hypothetical protein [Armatimonadota bacterium]